MDLNTSSKRKMSLQQKACRNCFVHPSIQVPVADEALPEMPCSYSVRFNNTIEYLKFKTVPF